MKYFGPNNMEYSNNFKERPDSGNIPMHDNKFQGMSRGSRTGIYIARKAFHKNKFQSKRNRASRVLTKVK